MFQWTHSGAPVSMGFRSSSRVGPDDFHQVWDRPPDDWELAGGEVHVWSALLDQPEPVSAELAATLSPDERARMARFRFDQERDRFLVGRGFLRQILGRYLGVGPAEIAFHYGQAGKPSLAPGLYEPLAFNLSHSGKLAVFALTRMPSVGVDIERVCWMSEADRIAQSFFLPEEKVRLRRASNEEKMRVFFEIWTCKEAVLKCAGRGLGEMDDLTAETEHFRGYIQALVPASGYVGCVALAQPPDALRLWQWQFR